jgi:hypothetical protein
MRAVYWIDSQGARCSAVGGSGVRYKASGFGFQVSGVRCQAARCQVSGRHGAIEFNQPNKSRKTAAIEVAVGLSSQVWARGFSPAAGR